MIACEGVIGKRIDCCGLRLDLETEAPPPIPVIDDIESPSMSLYGRKERGRGGEGGEKGEAKNENKSKRRIMVEENNKTALKKIKEREERERH